MVNGIFMLQYFELENFKQKEICLASKSFVEMYQKEIISVFLVLRNG